jgi:hypothetical protein
VAVFSATGSIKAAAKASGIVELICGAFDN